MLSCLWSTATPVTKLRWLVKCAVRIDFICRWSRHWLELSQKKRGSHIHQTQAAHEPTIQLCVFDAAKKGSKLGGSIEPLLNPGSIAVLTVKKVPSRYWYVLQRAGSCTTCLMSWLPRLISSFIRVWCVLKAIADRLWALNDKQIIALRYDLNAVEAHERCLFQRY